jgi:hypothetical protein
MTAMYCMHNATILVFFFLLLYNIKQNREETERRVTKEMHDILMGVHKSVGKY